MSLHIGRHLTRTTRCARTKIWPGNFVMGSMATRQIWQGPPKQLHEVTEAIRAARNEARDHERLPTKQRLPGQLYRENGRQVKPLASRRRERTSSASQRAVQDYGCGQHQIRTKLVWCIDSRPLAVSTAFNGRVLDNIKPRHAFHFTKDLRLIDPLMLLSALQTILS
jgi:hypothetical protein